MRRRGNRQQRESARRAELRALRAEARKPPRIETVYVRTYVRRPLWARLVTTAWLIIGGILIGGGVIPHHEDKPYLQGEAVAKRAVKPPKPLAAPPLGSPMSYSWAPAEGATAYKVVFFHEGKFAGTTETTEPNLTWTLPAGTYQWIVWPIVDGKQQSKAIVNSEVTTP